MICAANRQDECTGHFWEGRFKALRIVGEAGLLSCAMYADLNPVRSAMVSKPEAAIHTSAYDRFRSERGEMIDSAAFDLVPIDTTAAGKEIRETPAAVLKAKRRVKKPAPTGRRIRRDDWLAPLQLDPLTLSQQPQLHTSGLRASDKGSLQLSWRDYFELLRWTAQQVFDGVNAKVPPWLAKLLASQGIDVPMRCELVWNFTKCFGRGSCAGSSPAMAEDAQRHGRGWHRGQKTARVFFVAAA